MPKKKSRSRSVFTLGVYLSQQGLTQEEFAEKAGVSHRTVKRILAGYGCRLDTAQRIVKATKGCVPWEGLRR